MTNEEAIVILENEKPHCGMRITFTEEEKCEAFEMAIAALKAEPCEDAVSREAVLNCKQTFHDNAGYETEYVDVEDIKALPPVTPKQRTGKWIDDKCSVCGKGIEDLISSPEWYRNEEPNFCPNCGAKMEGVSE